MRAGWIYGWYLHKFVCILVKFSIQNIDKCSTRGRANIIITLVLNRSSGKIDYRLQTQQHNSAHGEIA